MCRKYHIRCSKQCNDKIENNLVFELQLNSVSVISRQKYNTTTGTTITATNTNTTITITNTTTTTTITTTPTTTTTTITNFYYRASLLWRGSVHNV